MLILCTGVVDEAFTVLGRLLLWPVYTQIRHLVDFAT